MTINYGINFQAKCNFFKLKYFICNPVVFHRKLDLLLHNTIVFRYEYFRNMLYAINVYINEFTSRITAQKIFTRAAFNATAFRYFASSYTFVVRIYKKVIALNLILSFRKYKIYDVAKPHLYG